MATTQLGQIAELAAQGALQPTIGLQRPFSAAIDTITAVEKGLKISGGGRVVLVF
jgi:hypothetical protein